jgi:39S ribosomal protein L53/MRP-L53
MITKYLTTVTAKINPFSRRSHAIRIFLSMIPAEARNDIQIKTRVVHQLSPSTLNISFSKR